jgi:transcriptional regulator with PAS, ATPase and Fis domain
MPFAPQPVSYLGMPAVIVSEPMQQLMAKIQRIGMSSASVLIEGESGVGKEVVARAIHHHSLRCQKAWVDVSCAALPEHLIESELFGYEKGAFSGADSSKPGLFELAHQGTLFLDEVGELEPKMQVKLLRVLDGSPYYRLGGIRKVSVDVRIIAATNQNLQQMVKAGRFRSDLYHRLGQLTLTVPPLRQRTEDIVPLAEFFLAQHNPRLRFASEACAKLHRYHWPGNIRELRNVVIKAAVLCASDEIRACDLAFETEEAAPAEPDTPVTDLDGIERRMIFRVLEQTGGHHQRAADLLGISRRTLSRKLKLYNQEARGRAYVS